MKKEYINPVIEVVMLQTNATILADSDTMEVTSDTTTTMDASGFFDNGDSEEW